MLKSKLFKSISFLVATLISLCLMIFVVFLVNYVQKLLYSDVQITLTEIVTQNKDVITSKLRLEMNNMRTFSEQLAEHFESADIDDPEIQKQFFLDYANAHDQVENYAWASRNGNATYFNGKEVDISGRKYFRLALEGTPNISERMISRMNGEDIFVICVPVKQNGEIIGTVQRQYTPQEMYALCSVSIFSEQGYMYIINSDGYILISSRQGEYSQESANYYRLLYATSPESSNLLQRDIQNKKAGFMEAEIDGEKVFSAYTSIDEVYDWYLISSVSTDAVSSNANIVIKMFYAILLGVALFFACLLFYFLLTKSKQQSRLKHIAFVDSVTNGNTLTKFTVDMQSLMKSYPDTPFYILAFDIDNFRYINSFYGFDTGDRLLHSIYQIYFRKLKEHELIARQTGDKFVLFLEDASEERLSYLFNPEMIVDGIKLYLSAGLYPITDSEESVNLMIDKANMAAQKIKGMRFKKAERYLEKDAQEMAENEQMKRAIDLALADDEIFPFFQPKVDIRNRKLVGAEALARWITKEGKLVSPAAFIPICEKTGSIVALDLVIFEKTLQFIKKNLETGVACVPISINFSRLHLLNPNFLDEILEKIWSYGIPTDLIELEITETAILENYEFIKNFISRLHENDLKISMDDFGSGYSSLHMLKDIDIDVLKVDGCFLRDTEHSDKQKAIFGTIIQMAQQLNTEVVVEGVETLENIALMKEFHCYTAQGYYFAKPMEEKDFQKYYEEGTV